MEKEYVGYLFEHLQTIVDQLSRIEEKLKEIERNQPNPLDVP